MLEGAASGRPLHAEDVRQWQHTHEENKCVEKGK
jgi:hypothetical protein